MAKKTTKAAKPAAAKGSKKTGARIRVVKAASNGHHTNPTADAVRASFLQHRGLWASAMAKMKVAEKHLKDVVAAAKSDGFLKKEFQIADALTASPKKEAKIVGEVTTRLRVARWIGHALGKQLDLFENPDAIASARPPADAAFDDGKQAALEGRTATPPDHFAAQELSQRWLAGYHEAQEGMVKAGIKPLEESPATDPPWTESNIGDPEAGKPAAGWGSSRVLQTVN